MRRLLILLCAALPAVTAAQDIRPADEARMFGWEALMGRALKGALGGGAPQDVAVLTEALSGLPDAIAPEGDWNCRTIKMGGGLPLVVYGNFRCRITEAGPGRWRLQKLTGSQFTQGEIVFVEGDAFYFGTGYVSGGPATDYAGLPPDDQTPVDPGQTVAEPGYFEQMGPDRARLLLPDPILESDFDILYLTR